MMVRVSSDIEDKHKPADWSIVPGMWRKVRWWAGCVMTDSLSLRQMPSLLSVSGTARAGPDLVWVESRT